MGNKPLYTKMSISTPQLKPLTWVWLIPFLLLLMWIGVRSLKTTAFWFDEYWSVYNAGGAQYGPLSPADIWQRVSTQDAWQAPSYFFALAGWGALVGWSEFATRTLSLLFGMLSIAWMYRLGRDLVSPTGAFAAAITVGASAYYLYFFHELRTYTLLVLLIICAVWAYWRIVYQSGGRWTQFLLFLSALLLLYTHYFAATVLIALCFYHLLFVPKGMKWWRAVLPLAAAGLLFLPWLVVLLSGLSSALEDKLRQSEAWSPRQIVQGFLYMFSNASVVLALIVGIYSFSRKKIVLFAWFWLLVVLVILLIVNARIGVILEVRYLFPLWPALGLIAALAIDRLAHTSLKSLPVMILAFWIVSGVWNSVDSASSTTLTNPHWHQPWNVLVNQLRPQLETGDSLAYLLPDWTWSSYQQKPFDYYIYGLPIKGMILDRPLNLGAQEYKRRIQALSTDTNRIWLAYTPLQPTTHVADFTQDLAPNFLYCGSIKTVPEITLDLYSSGIPDYQPISFDNKIKLTSLDAQYLSSSHQMSVTSLWSHPTDLPLNVYSVAFHIEDASGKLVGQTDFGLPQEVSACTYSVIPLTGLPAGTYTLSTAVYHWQTGQRLQSHIGQIVSDHPVIAQFTLP